MQMINYFRIGVVVGVTLVSLALTTFAAPTESLRSGGYFCGTDGTCQFHKPGDPDWLFSRFTYIMGYADCAGSIAEWRAKSPGCRLILYATGTDMPAYKSYTSNSYLFGRKSTYVRDRLVELGDIEESAYMHFYDDTKIKNWNGSGYDTVLIPGTYSMTITDADSASRVINSYTNYLFHSGNTYEGDTRLSPNFTNSRLRLAYKEYVTQAFNDMASYHWPVTTGYWDGIYFDNYSSYAMASGNLVSGGHVVESGTNPGDLMQIGTDAYRYWTWDWMKVFGREVRDTLQMADQWSADHKKKILAYNVGISFMNEYMYPDSSGADALNYEFGFDPAYSNNESYFRLENLYTRDSIASLNGATFFWCSRPRISYDNGSVSSHAQAIYDNLCFYYCARTDSTWIFMRPEPGNAYGVFLNSGFDTLAWIPAMEYDLGRPEGHYQLWDSGTSPDQNGAQYKIWVRDYQYGRVFSRPRDGFDAKWGRDSSPISVDLGGSYRQVQIDGTLGPVVSSVLIPGGEGAIMIPYTEGECVDPPTIPAPTEPTDGGTVSTTGLQLCVANSSQTNCSQPIRYYFQLSSNSSFTTIIAEDNAVPEGVTFTCWTVPASLDAGQTHYWRVKASNGITSSYWSTVFSFATENSPPSEPMLSNPGNGETVTSTRPTLVITNSTDPEGETLTYHFQVGTTSGFGTVVAENTSVSQGSGTTSWQVNPSLGNQATYYWRARAYDGFGYSNWSGVRSFYVNQTTVNNPPSSPTVNAPTNGEDVSDLTPALVVNNSIDDDGDPLTYNFQLYDSTNTTLLQQSGTVSPGGSTTSWTVGSALQAGSRYWWRARAFDGQNYSNWNQASAFDAVEEENHIPSTPTPFSPVDGDTVVGSFHVLAINNASDDDGDPLVYDFIVYSDSKLTKQVEIGTFIPENHPYTIYYTTSNFTNNHPYYWRARANDGSVWTNWCAPQMFLHVDVALDVEDAPHIIGPANDTTINQTKPKLRAGWSGAEDSVLFLFEVSESENFADLYTVGSATTIKDGMVDWELDRPLDNERTYFWRVQKSNGGYSETASFNVAAPIFVSPNPFSYLDGELTIHNLPDGAMIEVYTAAGDKVNEIDSISGDVKWDVRNSVGEKLGSGVYLYYVTAGDQRTSGKFVVVR